MMPTSSWALGFLEAEPEMVIQEHVLLRETPQEESERGREAGHGRGRVPTQGRFRLDLIQCRGGLVL